MTHEEAVDKLCGMFEVTRPEDKREVFGILALLLDTSQQRQCTNCQIRQMAEKRAQGEETPKWKPKPGLKEWQQDQHNG